MGAKSKEETWTSRFDRFSYREVLKLADEIEAHFQRLGVNLHPQSSLGKAIAATREVAKRQAENTPIGAADETALAKLDGVRIVERIGGGLRLFQVSPILQEKLRRLTKDTLDPHKGNRSRSRNVAFELHMAVRLGMSSWKVDLGEPDLICRNGASEIPTVFVACKQIESYKKLKARVQEAGRQIGRACEHLAGESCGVIAIDLSKLLDQQLFRAAYFESGENLLRNLAGILIQAFDSRPDVVRAACAFENVCGIIVDATVFTFTGDGGHALPVSVSQMAVTPLAKEGYPFYRVFQSLVPIRKDRRVGNAGGSIAE